MRLPCARCGGHVKPGRGIAICDDCKAARKAERKALYQRPDIAQQRRKATKLRMRKLMADPEYRRKHNERARILNRRYYAKHRKYYAKRRAAQTGSPS